MKKTKLLSVSLLAGLLAGCVGDGDTEVTSATVAAETPDSFLLYPNTQAPLAAGEYEVRIGPKTGAAAGNYRLLITYDDGRSETRSGSWPAAGTKTEQDIVLAHAGGLRLQVESAVATTLLLRREGDTLVVRQSDTGLIDLPLSQINSAAYGEAYYQAVDPTGTRTTLAAWKARNGFAAGADTHVIFRDAKDLGYGRDMYARRDAATGRIAVFVNNYVVALQPGSSTNYGPLNVEAAISQDSRYLQGTNAIEFSPANEDGASDNGAMKITKFFTYDSSGKRIASADLDGRGTKHMPGICWSCHGGQTLPLNPDGTFQAQALRSAKFNLIDAAQLEYSTQSAYQRPQLESGLRLINQYVHASFGEMRARSLATTNGHWDADYAIALAEGRYGAALNRASSDDDHVPEGWTQNPAFPARPVGVEQLFKQVVEPHCLGCHSLQGTTAGENVTTLVDGNNVSLANAINFSSYEKFIAYRSRIADYVYHRGLMPMSLRNFESFWKTPTGAPTLLASFLGDSTLFDASGKVIQPGHAVARPGANRTVKTLPLQLDGNASSFALSYSWRLKSQPGGGNASLLNAGTARPTLVTSGAVVNGNYEVELTVSNGKGAGTPVSSVITVDSSLAKTPHQLTFVDDVLPILTTDVTAQCTNCHSVAGNAGAHAGVPVYWTSDSSVYRRVMERVDLRDPENSRLLTKPTNPTHGGGVRIDTGTVLGRQQYSTILGWIREGAVCGSNATVCP